MTDDPLDGADIGTRESIETAEFRHWQLPEELHGDDRSVEDLDVEAAITTIQDGWVDLQLTWEGDAVKRLPRNWDYHAEPVTEAEKRRARRQRWGRVIGRALAFAIPAVLSIGFATLVMDEVSQSMTVNGSPVGDPSTASLVLTFGLIFLIAAIIWWGVRGGFPRQIGGGRR